MVQHAFPHELSAAVVKAAKTASRLGLFAANQGNLSVRDRTTGLIGITPHDYPYDDLTVDDLVVMAPDGTKVIGRLEPSYDVRVHRTVYELWANVHAVIHTEPPWVNALGTIDSEIAPVTTTGLKFANGAVPIMPFRTVRDEAFARDMLDLMGERYAVVWANHGLLVVGDTIAQALERTHGIELNAQVLAIARMLGEPRSLAYLDAAMVVA